MIGSDGKMYRLERDQEPSTKEFLEAINAGQATIVEPELKTRVVMPEREPSLLGPTGAPGDIAVKPQQPLPASYAAPLQVGLPAVAAIGTGLLSGPAAAATVPLAAGGGSLLANEINRRVVAPALGYGPPTPQFSQDPQREAALQFGVGVASEAIPGLTMGGLKAATTRPIPQAGRTAQAFREAGVPMKLTDISESRTPAMLESYSRQSVLGSPIITGTVKRQEEAIETYAQKEFLDRLGLPMARGEVVTGDTAKKMLMDNLQRGKTIENKMWGSLRETYGDHPIDVSGLRGWAENILGRAEEGLQAAQNPRLRAIAKEILEKSETGVVPFKQVDRWRIDLGQLMGEPSLISGVPSGQLSQAYGAILDDVGNSAQMAGNPQLMASYDNVRGFSHTLRKTYRDSQVADVVSMSPEAVIQRIRGAKSVEDLNQWKSAILGNIDPAMGAPTQEAREAWDMVRRHTFESILGQTSHGAGKAIERAPRGLPMSQMINGRMLQRELDNIGDEKLGVLLSPVERRALENVAIVSKALRTGERVGAMAYTSSTPQTLGIQAITTGAFTAGGLLGGGVGAFTGFMGSLLTPAAIAKLMVNPRAAEVMASSGFARLSREFGRRHLSREAAATMIRLIPFLEGSEKEQ